MYTPNRVYWELSLSKLIIQSLSNWKTPTGLLRQGTCQNLYRKSKGSMKDSQALAQPVSPAQETAGSKGSEALSKVKSGSCSSGRAGSCSSRLSNKEPVLRDLHQFMMGPEVRDTVQGIISVPGIILHPLHLTPASGVSLKLV